MKNIIFWLIGCLVGAMVVVWSVEATEWCCSYHGWACGISCCDWSLYTRKCTDMFSSSGVSTTDISAYKMILTKEFRWEVDFIQDRNYKLHSLLIYYPVWLDGSVNKYLVHFNNIKLTKEPKHQSLDRNFAGAYRKLLPKSNTGILADYTHKTLFYSTCLQMVDKYRFDTQQKKETECRRQDRSNWESAIKTRDLIGSNVMNSVNNIYFYAYYWNRLRMLEFEIIKKPTK